MSVTLTDSFGRVWTATGNTYRLSLPDDGSPEHEPLDITVTAHNEAQARAIIDAMAPAETGFQS